MRVNGSIAMKKILILEDEEVLGRIYKKKLEAAGFEVLWAKTVEETEDAVQHFPADVLLLDHGIRGHEKAGVELIAQLREILPDSKIIMLSNYSEIQLQEKAKREGADAYFVKINTPPQVLIKYIEGLF